MKQKNKITDANKIAPKVLTQSQLEEHLKNLKTQLVDAQTKVVMVQGAIQAISMQIEELNPSSDKPITNGVN